jgi:DNA-binding MarR family transcriptional regulator
MKKMQNTFNLLMELYNLPKPGDTNPDRNPGMPIQMAAVFLYVAMHDGCTMKQIAEVLGLSQASASRNCQALGKYQKQGKLGYDLVETVDDPAERRRKIVKLTRKGKRLAARLAEMIGEDGLKF